jgi:hypothetical protein
MSIAELKGFIPLQDTYYTKSESLTLNDLIVYPISTYISTRV